MSALGWHRFLVIIVVLQGARGHYQTGPVLPLSFWWTRPQHAQQQIVDGRTSPVCRPQPTSSSTTTTTRRPLHHLPPPFFRHLPPSLVGPQGRVEATARHNGCRPTKPPQLRSAVPGSWLRHRHRKWFTLTRWKCRWTSVTSAMTSAYCPISTSSSKLSTGKNIYITSVDILELW